MSAAKSFENLDLSKDELSRLSDALKKEEFRKLLVEYAEEISDPANKAKYESEIQQLEAERGMDVDFIHPKPGIVLKTFTESGQKTFINVCSSDKIGKPTSSKAVGADGKAGLEWSLPHSLAPPRQDKDKQGDSCNVFDVVFHPDTLRMSETNRNFHKFVCDTAFDGIRNNFGVLLQTDTRIVLKNMKFKGNPQATVIRRKKEDEVPVERDPDDVMNNFPYPYDGKTSKEKTEEKSKEVNMQQERMPERVSNKPAESKKVKYDGKYMVPEYSIVNRHKVNYKDYTDVGRSDPCKPDSLVVKVNLPALKSTRTVELDITENRLYLQCEKPAMYKLDIPLPYTVDMQEGSAEFDKTSKVLTITVPVVGTGVTGAGDVPALVTEIEHSSTDHTTFNQDSNNNNSTNTASKGSSVEAEIEKLKAQICSEVFSDEPVAKLKEQADEAGENVPKSEGDSNGSKAAGESSRSHSEFSENQSVGEECKASGDTVHRMVPQFDFDQTSTSVTLLIHVANAQRSSLVTFVSPDGHTIVIQVTSVGGGGFPLNYELKLMFSSGNVVGSVSRTELSGQNMSVELEKSKESQTMWESFQSAQASPDKCMEHRFTTSAELKEELDQLHDQCKPHTAQEDTLKLDLQHADKDDGGDSPLLSPVVIHQIEAPANLQGILKKSESIEANGNKHDHGDGTHLTGHSEGVQQTNGSRQWSVECEVGSPDGFTLSESEDSSLAGSFTRPRKKSVSFSERVEETEYKSAQSVAAMHTVLQKRKKRQKKKAKKIQLHLEAKERRRNHSGGNSELSSSEYHTDEEKHGASTTSDCSPLPVDSPRPFQSKSKSRRRGNRGKRQLFDNTVQKEHPTTERGDSQSVSTEYANSSCANELSTPGDAKDRRNQGERIDSTSSESSPQDSTSETTSNGDTSSVDNAAAGQGTKTCDNTSEKPEEPAESDDEDVQYGPSDNNHNQVAEKDQSKVSTVTEEARGENLELMNHKTKCAFSFTNDAVFDLD